MRKGGIKRVSASTRQLPDVPLRFLPSVPTTVYFANLVVMTDGLPRTRPGLPTEPVVTAWSNPAKLHVPFCIS